MKRSIYLDFTIPIFLSKEESFKYSLFLKSLIKNIDKPHIYDGSQHLILGNNAIYQLNILENSGLDLSNIKFKRNIARKSLMK